MLALARKLLTCSMGLTASTLVKTCAPPLPASGPAGASSCPKSGVDAKRIHNSQILPTTLWLLRGTGIVFIFLTTVFHFQIPHAMEFIISLPLLVVEKHADFRAPTFLNRLQFGM